jgi:phenylpropionate dioxygenase-like ring-hydroxylating dioxygenase large terminal subunit
MKDTPRKWATVYPELGTGPLPIDPCISPEHFELERERVFRRVWLKLARVEEIPKPGDYIVKEITVARTSVLLVRGKDGVIRAFHNMCSHRGNKIQWDDGGNCNSFECKFHGWTYDLAGELRGVPDIKEFFDFDKSQHGLTPIATDVWQGFVFINLNPKPAETLREFLGEIADRLDGYPFERYTQRFAYRAEIKCNWKVAYDAGSEAYHVAFVHKSSFPDTFSGKDLPLPRLDNIELYRYHRSADVVANPGHEPTPVAAVAYRYGGVIAKRATGATDLPPTINPTRRSDFGFSMNRIFPNYTIGVMDGIYYTHQFWPLSVDRTIWEGEAFALPPANAAERFSREYNRCMQRDVWREDTGTMEHTQSVLASGAKTHFILQDQEILIRHFYKVLEDFVGFYRKPENGNGGAANV